MAEENVAEQNPNRMLSHAEVAARLGADRPDILARARVLGVWVWVRFDKRPPLRTRKFLLDLGFHWNNKRQVWQHPCGHPSKRSQDDPEWKYGSFPLADALTEENIKAIA